MSEAAMGLPGFNEFEGVDEIDDVEREVVADGGGQGEFDEQEEGDGGPGGEFGGEIEAEGGEEDVADGIQDAVAVVAGSERLAAVTLDDHRRVFENLPGTFSKHGEEEAERQVRFTLALGEEAEEKIKSQAVDDVGEGVGVGDLLGELR